MVSDMDQKPTQPGTEGSKPRNSDKGYSMVAYEFYWRDETERVHFIGILPERRKKPERITQESVLNWGMKIIGDTSGINDIYFVQVEF
jgi:hypothetical protein